MGQLSEHHRARLEEFRDYVAKHVTPYAEQWDRDQRIPGSVITDVGRLGYLGGMLPADFGGLGWDTLTFGLANEAFGRGSSSLTGVFTVQAMFSMTLLKWGSADQKRRWLPAIANGDMTGAFALTEPGVGSALRSLATRFTPAGSRIRIDGTKRWISCGQFADVFLIFGKIDEQPAACLVPSDTPGLRVEPITELMGFRSAGLAQITLDAAEVDATQLVGRPGLALSLVAPVGLHIGRISTACSALGLLEGCFDESVARATSRRIGESTVGDFGMIRSLIARMGVDLEAARGLCRSACESQDDHRPEALAVTLMAKHFASRAAVRAASDAVQIAGASGVHASSAVSRFYRDSKIMEIIEGTTQIHEEILGKIFLDQSRPGDPSARSH